MTAFAEGRAVDDVGEAADPRQHFVKLVRALPGRSEGRNAAAADARDCAAFGIVFELGCFLNFGQDFFQQEACILI